MWYKRYPKFGEFDKDKPFLDGELDPEKLFYILENWDDCVTRVELQQRSHTREYEYHIKLFNGESFFFTLRDQDIIDECGPRSDVYFLRLRKEKSVDFLKDMMQRKLHTIMLQSHVSPTDMQKMYCVFHEETNHAKERVPRSGSAVHAEYTFATAGDALRKGEAVVLDKNAVAHPVRMGRRGLKWDRL